MSIRRRLWLSVTLLLGMVLLGNGIIVYMVERSELSKSLIRESRTFAHLAGPQALRVFGGGIENGDEGARKRLDEIAAGLPSLRAFALVSERGKLLLTHPPEAKLPPVNMAQLTGAGEEGVESVTTFGGESVLELTIPLHGREGSPPVLFHLLVSQKPVGERLAGLLSVYLGSFLVLLVLGALTASRIATAILGPLSTLKEAAIEISDGHLSARAPEEGSGEIADLARTFNTMAGEVESHRDQLEEQNVALTSAYGDLQAMQEEIVSLEKMAAVGRTAAAVSHEIDNPIGIILGTAQMLKKELDGAGELHRDAELIEEECKRCRRIVRDLLDLAIPGTGSCEQVDLGGVLEPVLRGIAHHPQFKKITINTTLPDEEVLVCADVDMVKQVLLNLLMNGAKAMEGVGEIEVSLKVEGGVAKILVLDRGPGIPEERLEKIFEPFFTTGGDEGRGKGLGLAVSRRMMEEQGGKLRGENRLGGGGVFIMEFPPARLGDEGQQG